MRSFRILLFIFPFLLGISIFSTAQEQIKHCGTDEMHQKIFLEYPQYNAGIVNANERLQEFTYSYTKQTHPKSGNPYIIPIVFHVIHNYGEENIGDAQIHDALKQLNLQFRKLNPDTTDIVTSFISIAADVEVEFRLAQLDPNGNCTSGITRTVSPLTFIGDHQVKSLIHWPPEKYLNVYICNQAAGLAGHALLPAAADTIPSWDGIVMQHSYIGTTGTSDYFRRTVLTHEVGHFLNLQHIWGGNNVPGYYYLPVSDAGNCAFDDDVLDTPLTIGWQACNLNNNSCSSLDNIQNYMDYAYCALMFTEGQKIRMHACLNSPVANRNNLWSPANLIATGADDLTYYLCKANFETSSRIACVGDVITLVDISVHGIESRIWDIPGAQVSSLTDSVITVSFLNPGRYSVNLEVTKGFQTLNKNETDYFTILPLSGVDSYTVEDFENEPQFQNKWVISPNESPANWELTSITGFNSAQSISVQNYGIESTAPYEFISQPIDASNLSAIVLSFDYAYAQKQSANIEQLQVSISKDCGASWLIRKTYYGSTTLKTVDTLVTTNFVPVNASQWNNDIISNIFSTYLTNDLLVKFTFNAKGGNNIYIDNINIADPQILGLNSTNFLDFEIYPNPANEIINVFIPEGNMLAKWSITNMLGQVVISDFSTYTGKLEISLKDLNSGIYLLELESVLGNKTIRIIKE